jgi:hypothetical protein
MALPNPLHWSKNKYINDWRQSWWKFSEEQSVHAFWPQKELIHFGKILKVKTVDEKLRKYVSVWLRHVTRMKNNRMPKVMLNYRPNGRRGFGRSFKRLID